MNPRTTTAVPHCHAGSTIGGEMTFGSSRNFNRSRSTSMELPFAEGAARRRGTLELDLRATEIRPEYRSPQVKNHRYLSKRTSELARTASAAGGCCRSKDRIFKPPISMTGAISQDRESCQFPFLLDGNSAVVSGGSAEEGSGGAGKIRSAARSNSERAAPSACVGKRFRAPHIVSPQ